MKNIYDMEGIDEKTKDKLSFALFISVFLIPVIFAAVLAYFINNYYLDKIGTLLIIAIAYIFHLPYGVWALIFSGNYSKTIKSKILTVTIIWIILAIIFLTRGCSS